MLQPYGKTFWITDNYFKNAFIRSLGMKIRLTFGMTFGPLRKDFSGLQGKDIETNKVSYSIDDNKTWNIWELCNLLPNICG